MPTTKSSLTCDLEETLLVALPRWSDRWLWGRVYFILYIEAARFWLIVAFFTSFCSRLRPRRFFFIYFSSPHLLPPNDCETPLPYVPPQSRAFSDVPPTADTDFWLVDVSPGLMAATYGHGPIPLSLNFRYFNSTTESTTRRPPTHSSPAACPHGLTLHRP